MPGKDTITISDSLRSWFLLVDKPEVNTSNEVVQPADSLWGAGTLSLPIPAYGSSNSGNNDTNYYTSGAIILFLVLLFLFFREVKNTIPIVLKGFFDLKIQLSIEERLSSSNQRNTTALVSLLMISLIYASVFGEAFYLNTGLGEHILVILTVVSTVIFWIIKTIVNKFAGWITKSRQAFVQIGKIGYNHFIVAAILTTPLFSVPYLDPGIDPNILFKYLIICYMAIFVVYLLRVRQIIISYHFSHFFYILYLCSAEILPPVLLINFILSYN
jgi:hypothetical protein